jgi:hypothetical protein
MTLGIAVWTRRLEGRKKQRREKRRGFFEPLSLLGGGILEVKMEGIGKEVETGGGNDRLSPNAIRNITI